MLSIGIDVSKGKSTVCGMKPGGEIVYAPFEVQHTREEMSELVSLLRSSGEEVRAVLESTGSYHCPVVTALLENGIFVSVVNSLRMKRFCSQSIRKVKTDRIDAMHFTMVMAVDVGAAKVSVGELRDLLEQLGQKMEISIRIQREEIFDAMHRI